MDEKILQHMADQKALQRTAANSRPHVVTDGAYKYATYVFRAGLLEPHPDMFAIDLSVGNGPASFSLAEAFRAAFYRQMPRELSWFHQCETVDYHRFEFWREPDKVRGPALEVANKIGETLGLTLTKV